MLKARLDFGGLDGGSRHRGALIAQNLKNIKNSFEILSYHHHEAPWISICLIQTYKTKYRYSYF
jgi:hypothetical protein